MTSPFVDRVLVLGGSAAGLFTAGALAPVAREIVLVERDRLPVDTSHRKGTPQSRHANNLLPRANALLERWFPGIVDELVSRGAVLAGANSRLVVNGHRLARTAGSVTPSLLMTRPLLDETLRRRVRALPNVTFLDGHHVVGLLVDRTTRAVGGARVRPTEDRRPERDLRANVVVDAMGRGSRASGWLSADGWAPPSALELRVGVRYVTRFFSRTPGDAAGDKLLIVTPTAQVPRGAVAFAVEGDRWLVTAYAYGGTSPPMDVPDFRAFLGSLVAPDIADSIAHREPLGDAAAFHYPVVRVRRFDALPAPPAGFVALGDALANLSPSYGQGMTSAALQVDALARSLGAIPRLPPEAPLDSASVRRFYRAAVAAASGLFDFGWSSDSSLPGFDGPRDPTPAPIRWYVRRAMRVATRDPFVADRVRRVAGALATPASLLAPRVAWRVLRPGAERAESAR
ncbi:MAG: hypothetical protein U0414_43795 [Polyangiaceae bacterium]